MSLKLNLTIPNKAIHALIVLIVFLFVAGALAYVYDVTNTVPNPGHPLSTIQGYFHRDASLIQTIDKLQQRSALGMACGVDEYIKEINVDGTVVCEPDDSGGAAGVTDVLSGEGTQGGVVATVATIEFDCSEVSGNGITCSGEDVQVNTGSVTTTGLEIVSDQVRLMDNGCAAREVLKRNSSNNGWECVADNTGGTLQCTTIQGYHIGVGTFSCPAGYTAVGLACGVLQLENIYHDNSVPAPIGAWTNYLTPNVNNATGGRCESMGSQFHALRCCRVS